MKPPAAIRLFPPGEYPDPMAFRVPLLLVLLLLSAGCAQQAGQPRPGQPVLEFSTGACNRDLDPSTAPGAGTLETLWENDTTLLVSGFLKTWCGGAVISGNYTLQGENLTLFSTVSTPGPVTSCLCTRGIQYRILNIPRRDYRIVLEGR